jgi:iron complex outermembrane receptor protein
MCALLSAVSFPTIAYAQTTPPADQPATDGSAPATPGEVTTAPPAPQADDGLGEITVTARKTSESLITVPVAVTALTAQAIQARGIRDIDDVAAFAPGFHRQQQTVGRNDRGFKTYQIRGVNAGVGIFVDGAPVNGGNIAGVNDIERVEIVKGPQSAFFGRGTFAGAVNFITREPSFDVGGSASLQYERFDTADFNASIEGGLIKNILAIRISGRVYHTDGAYDDVNYPGTTLGERNTRSISANLLFTPTSNLKIRAFGVRWNDSDGLPANGRFGINQQNCNPGASAYICGGVGGGYNKQSVTWNQNIVSQAYSAVQNGTTLYGPNFVDHLGLERVATQARLLADWNLGDWTVSGIGSYGQNKWGFMQTGFGTDTRGVPNTSATVANGRIPYVYSLTLGNTKDIDKYGELRVASPKDRPISATLGVNYFNGKFTNMTTSYGVVGYQVNTPITVTANKTYSVFGSVKVEPFQGVSLSGEGRYQIDKIDQTTFAATTAAFGKTFRSFSPRAILQYAPTNDSSVYVSYAIGNRPGSFNTTYAAQTDFVKRQIEAQTEVGIFVPEDKIKMGEVGYKTNLFNNRLRLLYAAYIGKWTGRPISNSVLYYLTPAAQTANSLSNLIISAPDGKVDLKGIELEAAFKVNHEITLEGAFSIADTNIRKTYCSDCVAVGGAAAAYQVGTQLPGYARNTGTIGATYAREVGTGFDGYLRADAIYTGKQFDSEGNYNHLKAATVVNLRVGFTHENYRFEIFGTNVTNNKTPVSLGRAVETQYGSTGATIANRSVLNVALQNPVSYGARVGFSF